jgi:hypothetical protein
MAIEQPPSSAGADATPPIEAIPQPPTARRRLSTEIVLETMLIILVGSLFTYMLVDSVDWHPDVARLPRLASGLGLMVLVVYVVRRIATYGRQGERAAILDLGFDEEGLDRATIVRRTLRFVLSTAALFLGCWLIGFHTAVPVYVFAYLVLWAKVRWYWAVGAAAFFVAYMVLAYDVAIQAQWPEPLFGPFDK